ncbi:GNAT family N-acetyltransferase [Thalassobacillus sp. C254]|uniref:GNAT family N-acetyltransferase n=1 Tax=Thalassobacillus sp. C254 TaxID=1225341 RepID=UPI0006CF84BC|nr:GNAT family N-acetyltransferase [Thalassobacillus sp. C254]
MSKEFKIRTFTINDYEEVYELWEHAEGVVLGSSDTKERIHMYLIRNPDLSVVASEGGRIIGALLAGHDGRRGYLHHLAVHPDWQRNGLGKSLTEEALKRLREDEIEKCHVFVLNDNEKSDKFCESIGFSKQTHFHVNSINL